MRHLVIGFIVLVVAASAAAAEPIKVVAAENFYGDIARQIGGGEVAVASILDNPDQDPHEFEASPSTARAFAEARIVIVNGVGYDEWATKLLNASPSPSRAVVSLATLLHKQIGANPHLWYDPAAIPALAKALAGLFAKLDPVHQADFARRLARFQQSFEPLDARIAALRARYSGTPVTATEPVFGYMFEALGMQVRNMPFQMAVMNGTEPSASDVAAFERDLRTHAVKLLVYNAQASDPIAARMERLAKASGVPIVGAAETEPPGKSYQGWMMGELDDVAKALPAKP